MGGGKCLLKKSFEDMERYFSLLMNKQHIVFIFLSCGVLSLLVLALLCCSSVAVRHWIVRGALCILHADVKFQCDSG